MVFIMNFIEVFIEAGKIHVGGAEVEGGLGRAPNKLFKVICMLLLLASPWCMCYIVLTIFNHMAE